MAKELHVRIRTPDAKLLEEVRSILKNPAGGSPEVQEQMMTLAKAIGALVDGLGVRGRLVIVGASADPFAVSSFQLIGAQRTIVGWPSGTSKDSEDTLKFAALTAVRAMIETFPIERASEGYERMITGKVRFRAVLIH